MGGAGLSGAGAAVGPAIGVGLAFGKGSTRFRLDYTVAKFGKLTDLSEPRLHSISIGLGIGGV